MECHKCEHQADMAAGKYAGVAWEKTPCGKCSLEEDSTYTLEYDDERDGKPLDPAAFVGAGSFFDTWVPVEKVAEVLNLVCEMSAEEVEVIRRRVAKQTYEQIARDMIMSRSRVEWLQQRACERWPLLWALFPRKVSRARKLANKQGDQGAKRPIGVGVKARRRRGYKLTKRRKELKRKRLQA